MTTRLGVLLLALSLTACSDGDDDALHVSDLGGTCPAIEGDLQPPPECPANVYICAIGDGRWTVRCKDGHVFKEAATIYEYCECGSDQHACELRTGGPRDVFTCAGACLDSDDRYFDDFAEFMSFPAESLCAEAPST